MMREPAGSTRLERLTTCDTPAPATQRSGATGAIAPPTPALVGMHAAPSTHPSPARAEPARPVPPSEFFARYAWHYHARAAVLMGIWGGIAVHSEYILIKILGGSPEHVAALIAVGTGGLLTGVFSGPLMHGRAKRPFFLIVGAGGRIGLVLMALATTPAGYLIGFGLFGLSDAFLIPALTNFLQANYNDRVRNRYFGAATRRALLVAVVVAILAGRLLDAYPESFRWLLLLAAATGAWGWWLVARVRFRTPRQARPVHATARAVGGAPAVAPTGSIARRSHNPIRTIIELYRTDRRFLRFELQFMLYGVAFISISAVIPTYLTAEYAISFNQVAYARGLLFIGTLAFGVPLVVRLVGHRNPIEICVLAFTGLGIAVLLVFAAPLADHALASIPAFADVYQACDGVLMLYAAFVFFGLAMCGVHVVWNLASIHFAGGREATTYQGAHNLMVGLRGIVAPFVGVWIATQASPFAAFVTSASLFFVAAGSMAHFAWQERRRTRQAAASASA